MVAADDSCLDGVDTIRDNPSVSKLGLLSCQCNTRHVTIKVFGGISDKGSPPTPNIQHAVSWLEVELGAHNGKLVVLKHFK